MGDHDTGKGFAAGLLLGALIGAGVALLFAPQSGEDTRRLIRKKARRFANDARDRYDDLKDRVRKARKEAAELISD